MRPTTSLLWSLYGGTLKDLSPLFKANNIAPLSIVEGFQCAEMFLKHLLWSTDHIIFEGKASKVQQQNCNKVQSMPKVLEHLLYFLIWLVSVPLSP